MASLTKNDFLEEDSNDSTPVSKTPEMDSDMSIIETWFTNLSDVEKIAAYFHIWKPYENQSLKEIEKRDKYLTKKLKPAIKRLEKQEKKKKKRSEDAKAKSGFNKSEKF